MSSVVTSCPGSIRLRMPDGTLLSFTTYNIQVKGLLSETKIVSAVGTITIQDLTNNITSKITFDANSNDRAGFIGSFFKDKETKDEVTGGF